MAIVIPILTEYSSKGLDQANQDLGQAQTGWQKAGSAIQSAALPAGVALAGLGAVAMKGIGAAEEAAAANAKLSQVFESMGLSRNTQEALDYADALSKQIGVDDEIIKGAQTKLATFSEVSKSVETMGRATSLAADLSAAGFGSMDSAAVLLGKALQDPTKGLSALSRVGVTLSKQQEKQVEHFQKTGQMAKAQAVIFGAVEKQVGGVAEASATGSQKMSVAFGEVTEAIGAALLPTFEKLVPIAMSFGKWAQDNAGFITAVGVAIAGLAATIIALATALKVITVIQSFINLMKAWEVATKLSTAATWLQNAATKAMAVTQWLLNAAMAANPIGLIIIAIVALIAIIVLLWTKCETFRKIVTAVWEAIWHAVQVAWEKIKEWTSKVLGWLLPFIKGVWDNIKRATAAAWDWFMDAISKAWAFVKWVFLHTNPIGIIINYWDNIKRATQAVWDWVVQKIKWAWSFIKDLWHVSPLGMVIDHLQDIKDAVMSVFDWIVEKAEWLWDKLSGIFDTIGEGFSKVGGIIDKLPFVGSSSASAGAAVVPVGRALSLDGAGVRALAGGLEGVQTFATQRRGSGAQTIININGAIDPDSTARQVKRLLEGADVRQGRAAGQASAVAW